GRQALRAVRGDHHRPGHGAARPGTAALPGTAPPRRRPPGLRPEPDPAAHRHRADRGPGPRPRPPRRLSRRTADRGAHVRGPAGTRAHTRAGLPAPVNPCAPRTLRWSGAEAVGDTPRTTRWGHSYAMAQGTVQVTHTGTSRWRRRTGEYASLAAALEAAADGDVLTVAPGTYRENLV